MKKYLATITLLFAGISIQAGPVERYFLYEQQHQFHTQGAPLTNTVKTSFFNQQIDPKHPELGHFKQRYYVDDSYATDKNSPVFFYICGEAACSQYALNGAIRYYAKQYHARLIALEHRYYGQSQPFNDLSAEHLQYLTIENALADLAHFQNTITNDKGWTGKWVSFGGSYPGSLSAYYRTKYPNLVVGAIASSAPVRAQEAYPEYDQHVTKVAGPHCAELIRQVIQQMEQAQANQHDFYKIKHLFRAKDIINDVDFLYLVADIGATAIQYGMHEEFCGLLSDSKNALHGYAKFAKKIYSRYGATAVDFTAQAAENESLDDHSTGIGLRQWFYQSCLEYGYWQVAHENPLESTRSSQIDLAYHHQICQRLFKIDELAAVEKTNDAFFYPILQDTTTNIIFTNGSNDPWSILSITPNSQWASNPNLIYELIEGTAHCADLHSPRTDDSVALTVAREKTSATIKQWLS